MPFAWNQRQNIYGIIFLLPRGNRLECMKKTQLLAILNLVALLVHVTLSYFTQFKLINDLDIGQVADTFGSLFTPADITFAIWGVIYTALLFFCIYHIRMAFNQASTHPANQNVNRVGGWFIINNIIAAAWLLVWTRGMIFLSTGLIVFQLVTVVIINLRLRIHDPFARVDSKIFTQFPLSIYFGWLTIATIANISILLIASGWDGFGFDYTPIEWTRITIGIAVFLAVSIVFARRNVLFGLVVVWALYGIVLKRASVNPGLYSELIKTAWAGMAIVAVSSIIQFILNISSKGELRAISGNPSSLK